MHGQPSKVAHEDVSQVLEGPLPEEYRELREPSVPDLSYVFGHVRSPLSLSLALHRLALYCMEPPSCQLNTFHTSCSSVMSIFHA